MGEFGLFLLADDIQELFDEVDLYLESKQALEYLASESRDRRLNKARWLDPVTDSSWRPADEWRQVQAIVTHEVKVNGTPRNQIWLTFSDVSKIGQRMKISGGKSTPVGIFAFPIEFALKKRDNLPFSDRAYLHVFRTKKPHFEAGHGDATTDSNFQNVKDKLPAKYKTGSSNDPRVNEFKEELNVANNQFNSSLLQMRSKPDHLFVRSTDLYYNMQDWAARMVTNMVYAAEHQYAVSSMPVKMQKVIEQNPWLGNPREEMEREFSADSTIVKHELVQYITNLTRNVYVSGQGYNDIKMFTDIQVLQDDLSVRLSDEFAAYIKQHEYDWRDYQMVVRAADSPLTVRLQLDDLIYPFPGQFDYYSPIYTTLQKWKRMPLHQDQEFQITVLEYLQKLRAVVDKYSVEEPSVVDEGDPLARIPFASRLKAYAAENNLDLNQAVTFALVHAPKRVFNPNQFLYRVAHDFAKQLSARKGSKSDWRMQWSVVLRGLGIASVADTQHSGHVHDAEPTQGVFMDPADIIHIATIIQRSHSSQNDPANRPPVAMHGEKDPVAMKVGFDTWSPSKTMHTRQTEPVDQRKGALVLDKTDTAGLTDKDRLHMGLWKRVEVVSRVMNYHSSIVPTNIDMIDDALTKLIKLAKAHNRLKSSGYKPGKKYHRSGSFDTHMREAIKKMRRLLDGTTSAHLDPKIIDEIGDKFDKLELLARGESIKTPQYRRRGPPDEAESDVYDPNDVVEPIR